MMGFFNHIVLTTVRTEQSEQSETFHSSKVCRFLIPKLVFNFSLFLAFPVIHKKD